MKKPMIAGLLGVGAAILGVSGVFFHIAVPRRKRTPAEPDPDKMTQIQKEMYELARVRKDWIKEQEMEEWEISSKDGLKLRAHFLHATAQTSTKKVILAVHGYRNSGINEWCYYAPFYQKLGFHLLMVDDRAHGDSEGNYIGYGWNDHFDCLRWIDYLLLHLGRDTEIFLHGISMGAATVMMVAGEKLPKQVKGIISDCGYTSACDQFTYVLKHQYHLPKYPILPVTNVLNQIIAGYNFKDCSAINALKKAKVPILFIHGDEDDFVPTYMGYENYDACASKEKEFVLIKGAGHAQSYYVNPKEYEEAVTKFITAHLEKEQ